MSKYMKMEVVMMAGMILLSLMAMTSKAQDALPCWDRIGSCLSSSTTVEQCCEVVVDDISNERECFCGAKSILDQNATVSDGISQLLMICDAPPFDTLCPDSSSIGRAPAQAPTPASTDSSSSIGSAPAQAPTPASGVEFQDEPCWQRISDCVGENVNRSGSNPQFDPSSPSFNSSEFMCCPLIQETAITDKQCFCTVNTFIVENPSQAPNVTQFLSVCGIPDSDALNSFCLGEAPNPAPARAPVPIPPSIQMTPPQAPSESLAAKTPSAEDTSGAIKSKTTGSLYSLLVLLTYLIFH